jgi:hypothetical protein
LVAQQARTPSAVEQQTSDATVSLSSVAHFPAWVNDLVDHEAAVEHGGAFIPREC